MESGRRTARASGTLTDTGCGARQWWPARSRGARPRWRIAVRGASCRRRRSCPGLRAISPDGAPRPTPPPRRRPRRRAPSALAGDDEEVTVAFPDRGVKTLSWPASRTSRSSRLRLVGVKCRGWGPAALEGTPVMGRRGHRRRERRRRTWRPTPPEDLAIRRGAPAEHEEPDGHASFTDALRRHKPLAILLALALSLGAVGIAGAASAPRPRSSTPVSRRRPASSAWCRASRTAAVVRCVVAGTGSARSGQGLAGAAGAAGRRPSGPARRRRCETASMARTALMAKMASTARTGSMAWMA